MKIRIILLYILVLPFMVGCDKWIQLEPENSVTYTNSFKNELDVYSLLVNLLNSVKLVECSSDSFSPKMHNTIGEMADKVNKVDFYGQRTYSPGNIGESAGAMYWTQIYGAINSASVVIDEAYRFENISQERIDFYIQQAHFFRARAYFRLAITFGDAPITGSYLDTQMRGRSNVQLVLEEAIKSAKIALDLPIHTELKDLNKSPIKSKFWASKGAAGALLADIYAWRGSLNNNIEDTKIAENYCTRIINGEYGAYGFEPTNEDVCTKTLHRQGTESIFEVDIDHETENNWGGFSGQIYPTVKEFMGYPIRPDKNKNSIMDFEIHKSTINSLYEPQDKRLAAYYAELDTRDDDEAVFIKKFRYIKMYRANVGQAERFINLDVNYVIYRLTGIYLLRAELRNRAGIAGAVDDLNKVRARAGATAYPGGPNDGKGLAEAIFAEFDREMIFERERYYDVVRNKMWNSKFDKDFPGLSDLDVERGALYSPIGKSLLTTPNDLIIQTPYWSGR